MSAADGDRQSACRPSSRRSAPASGTRRCGEGRRRSSHVGLEERHLRRRRHDPGADDRLKRGERVARTIADTDSRRARCRSDRGSRSTRRGTLAAATWARSPTGRASSCSPGRSEARTSSGRGSPRQSSGWGEGPPSLAPSHRPRCQYLRRRCRPPSSNRFPRCRSIPWCSHRSSPSSRSSPRPSRCRAMSLRCRRSSTPRRRPRRA